VQNNYIAENDYGITVEEGVAVNMDGNVVEKNKLGGVYFDEEKRAEGAPPTGKHMSQLETLWIWHGKKKCQS
jgi:hypothetical protein